jgi:hypothetical protein
MNPYLNGKKTIQGQNEGNAIQAKRNYWEKLNTTKVKEYGQILFKK